MKLCFYNVQISLLYIYIQTNIITYYSNILHLSIADAKIALKNRMHLIKSCYMEHKKMQHNVCLSTDQHDLSWYNSSHLTSAI